MFVSKPPRQNPPGVTVLGVAVPILRICALLWEAPLCFLCRLLFNANGGVNLLGLPFPLREHVSETADVCLPLERSPSLLVPQYSTGPKGIRHSSSFTDEIPR